MNKTIIFFTLAFLLGFSSCKKEEYTIQGQVKAWDISASDDRLEPVVGLPISIYYAKDPSQVNSLSMQKYRCKSITDKNGYYHFTVEEPEDDFLNNFNAYLVKSTPFDSTRVEWQYLSDTVLYKAGIVQGSIYFSQEIGHSLDPTHGLKVVPAGWVFIRIENPTCNSISVTTGNYLRHLYNSPNGSFLNALFWLTPSKTHKIKLNNTSGDSPVEVVEIDVYVRNSFVRSSRPWNENLIPDTVIIDMSTMAYRVIKADLE